MAEIREYVDICTKALGEKKGENIKVINISGLSPLADYFVLVTGNNSNQLQALSDEVLAELGKVNLFPKQVEGYHSANWILMDYGDFMVHLFTPDSRDYYKLERIWKDAPCEEIK